MADIDLKKKKVACIHEKLSLFAHTCGREAAESWGKFKNEQKGNLNYHFMLNLCYGPWRGGRQMKGWKKVYSKLEKFGGEMTQIVGCHSKDDLGFPFEWQFNHASKISKYLNAQRITFVQLIGRWKTSSGLEIRDELKKITGVNTIKVFSTFIRGYLGKENIFLISSYTSCVSVNLVPNG